jgi:hypothetical protein
MTIKEGYTRVSEILSPWVNFSHIDPEVLANKARIGTNVHEKISAEESGIYLGLEDDEVPYFESYERWSSSVDIKVQESERRLYSETFKLTGCVDAIIKSEDKKILLDFKTSASPHHKSWGIQGALYHWLCLENNIPLSDEIWFLQLKKNGKAAKLHKYIVDSSLLEAALAAVKIYRYFNP